MGKVQSNISTQVTTPHGASRPRGWDLSKASFDSDFYLATLRTAQSFGIGVIPKWKCALLMAIVYVFGNNEGFTLSKKFNCDRIFIQETYHIDGGEVPDADFAELLRQYVTKCEAVKNEDDEFFKECAELIKERYNFKLLC